MILIVEVRRESVIRDALYQIESKPNGDLRKQLRVTFSGEDGIDEGGIQKEFFQIITKEMFSTKVGLYTTNEESRTSWFSFWEGEQQKDMADEYRLLGKLMGLAFYNGVHLDINFTPAVYKRLLKNQITLRDLKEFDPVLITNRIWH